MTRPLDLLNRKFGRWIVLARSTNGPAGKARWLCQCQCGEQRIVNASALIKGGTLSCGCYRSDTSRALKFKHGMSRTPVWYVWGAIKSRCLNPANKSYKNYGGRGIRVCDRWRDSFMAFLADMGDRPTSKHTIERINNDGDYEPSNCKWATWLEQAQNKRPRQDHIRKVAA